MKDGFGRTLARRRREAGVSQVELAAYLGLSGSGLCRLEGRKVSREEQDRYLRALARCVSERAEQAAARATQVAQQLREAAR